ncbi:MAG: O-antigen ligase family protein [Patulibacter sp.]|nr:O-antigen ligase family protein [Patulibacter sp.]
MATALALTAITLAATLAMVLRGPRARAGALALAMVGGPAILAIQVWDTGPVEQLRESPLLFAAVVIVGLAVLGVGAAAFRRWPLAVPIAVTLVLPFRLPLDLGDGQAVNLLLPLYVVTGAAALAWVWERFQHDPDLPSDDPRPGFADVALLLFVVLYAVQSAWSIDQGQAVEQVAFFYVPFSLLYVVLRTIRWTPQLAARCLGVAVGVALVLAAVGFYEYATRHVLLNPRIIASNQIEDAFRVNSLFFDPNIYGRFLILVVLGVAARMLWARDNRTVLITALVLVVLWAALVLTYSQTSFVSLLVGLAILGGLRFGPWKAFGTVLAIGAVAAALLFAAPSALNIDGFDGDSLDDATSGRVALTNGGIRLFANEPVLGVGSGAFAREYRRAEHAGQSDAVAASHTIPITIAAEQGLVGLIAYLVLLVAVLRRLLRDAEDCPARAAIAAMVIALVVHTMGYAAFLEDPVLWVLLAVGGSLATTASAAGRARREPRVPRAARVPRAS